jgi:hypothetical protein
MGCKKLVWICLLETTDCHLTALKLMCPCGEERNLLRGRRSEGNDCKERAHPFRMEQPVTGGPSMASSLHFVVGKHICFWLALWIQPLSMEPN